MLLGRTAAGSNQDIVRFRKCTPGMQRKREMENVAFSFPAIAERDFPRESPSFVASVAANYKRILFFMSHLPTRYKKLISLSGQFRFISIVLGKSSGTSCMHVACYLNRDMMKGKKVNI